MTKRADQFFRAVYRRAQVLANLKERMKEIGLA